MSDASSVFRVSACHAALSQFEAACALPEARECFEAWLDAELAACGDELFGRRFASYHPQLGMPWTAFLPRILTVAPGTQVLAGIRFKGGDTELPFVRVAAWDVEHPHPERWIEPLSEAFSDFRPTDIQLTWPGASPPTREARVDQHHVMARLSELRERARPWGEVGVDVRVARAIDFHPELVAAMARWRVEVGPRSREVFTTHVSDLNDALDTGVVLTVHQGEVWRGVMAARRAAHRWADGYEVVELFLDAPLRGARRAHVVQRRLIDALVDHGRDVLWGTIHGSNRPSLRTAQRCGRRIVETSWFLPVP